MVLGDSFIHLPSVHSPDKATLYPEFCFAISPTVMSNPHFALLKYCSTQVNHWTTRFK